MGRYTPLHRHTPEELINLPRINISVELISVAQPLDLGGIRQNTRICGKMVKTTSDFILLDGMRMNYT